MASMPGSVPLTAPIDHRSLMLLGKAPLPFKQPGWAWELKFDGYRVLAFRDRDGPRLLSRNGKQLGLAVPEVVRAIAALPEDCVLDGELVLPDDQVRPD